MGKPAIQRRNLKANDKVLTPPYLAEQIVQHFAPTGICLDPFAGDGAFIDALLQFGADCDFCENDPNRTYCNGVDFFNHTARANWILSNPPYSILSDVLEHSFKIAHNVGYLVQTPAPFFTKRLRIAKEANFGIREIYRVDCPDEWKRQGLSFGTGLAAVWWQKWHAGPIYLTDGRKKLEATP